QEQRHDAEHEQRRADDVYLAGATHRCRREVAHDHDHGDEGYRHVDEEDPAPADRVRYQAAGEWTDDAREAEDRPRESLVGAALTRREDVTDRGERHRDEGAATEALQAADDDELGHVLREPAERGGRAEQQDPEDQDPLAAVDVRELAVYRERDGGSQRVSGERSEEHTSELQSRENLV